MVRSSSYYDADHPALTIKTDNRYFHLETVFDKFTELYDGDPDQTFEKMEEVLTPIVPDIEQRLEFLKKYLAKTRPDEFDYIPSDDYTNAGIKIIPPKPEPPPKRIDRAPSFNFLKVFAITTVAIFILSIAATIVTCSMESESTPPPKATIHIEKLEPL